MNKKITLSALSIFCTAMLTLTACDDSSVASKNVEESSSSEEISGITAESDDDLPNCTEKREGLKATLADESIYQCTDGKWVLAFVPTPTVETLEDLPACSSKREGDPAIVTDENALYVCESGKWQKTKTFMATVNSEDDLKNCTKKIEGDSAYAKNENIVYVCAEEKWRVLGGMVALESDLSRCTEKREGSQVFIKETGIALICNDEKWFQFDIYDLINDTPVVVVSSSSREWEKLNSSSSSKEEAKSSSSVSSSSSTAKEKSSSSVQNNYDKFVTWLGACSEYRVETGFDDGTDTYGYWQDYNDAYDGGSSTITYPVAKGNVYADDAMDPIIDECGGVCGTATMGSGYDYPYVGIGFNIGGEMQTGFDISAWGGICIVYKSTAIAPALEIVPENEASVTAYNNYKATLKTQASPMVVNLAWSDFKQESGWGKKVDQATILASAAAIKFKISAAAGKSTEFNITAIGPKGACF